MSMVKLAVQNFKSSFRNYLSLILSMAFTILIFLNFQYIVFSDAFAMLGEQNKDNIDIVVNAILIVLGCFMFFFIWYSTNVFLTRRKKEIGIYVFMGLSNQRIGKLYMMECLMTGILAMILGVGFGVLVTQLFQMILLAISDISVEIRFHFEPEPILITIAVYLIMYGIFVIKGYVSIVRSSVLEMVSANRQNEYVRQKGWLLIGKAVVGIIVLGAGYYLAVKDGGQEVMGNVLIAVVLVIIGVYLLFGGFIPFVFQKLEKNKKFLYQKQRTLWVSNVIFRMKKNYRSYAMTSVLMLCSVTALATGFAMKMRYDNIVHFRNTYTYQIVSVRQGIGEEIADLIKKDNQIDYSNEIPMLQLDPSLYHAQYEGEQYVLLSYSEVAQAAEDAGLAFEMEEPAADELIEAGNVPLISIITEESGITITLDGKEFRQTDDVEVPYLGYLQESMSFYIVNDQVYREFQSKGQQLYTYNYRIDDIYNYEASMDELDTIVSNTPDSQTGRIAIDPRNPEGEWIKILYSVCVFMFLVFTLASGSILFMKLYNDAFEERERYGVLRKLGFSQKTIEKSISRELLMTYALPFLVMALSSFFSVHALAKMTHTSLLTVNVVSVGVTLVIFLICYLCSILVYRKNISLSEISR